jgi:hypothetical protein
MCRLYSHITDCAYCPDGGADTLSCEEHQKMVKDAEEQTRKNLQDDSEDLEQKP